MRELTKRKWKDEVNNDTGRGSKENWGTGKNKRKMAHDPLWGSGEIITHTQHLAIVSLGWL